MELKKYKLRDLLQVTRGTSLSGEFYDTQGKYIRLTCGNFDYRNNCFKENKSKENIYFVGDFKKEFLLEEGDIITPLTEQAIGLLGSTAKIPESGKYIQSQDVAKIICDENLLDRDYAFYLISSKSVKRQLSAGAQQTKIRHTSPDKIKDCIVWVPSLEVQKSIGRILSDIDCKIAINKQINDNLEAMAKQLYDYWFVQFDFPNEEGKPYKSSGGKMVWNEKLKREIPDGWSCDKLTNVLLLLKDGTHNPPSRVNSGIALLTGTMFGKNFLDYSKASYIEDTDYKAIHKQYQPQKGDIIMTKIGTLGNINILRNADIPIAIHCNSALLRFASDWGEPFPFWMCKSPLFQARLKAVKGQSIQEFASLGKIGSINIEIPPIRLIELFNNTINKVLGKQILISYEIAELTKQRDELLPLLMNGQVSVNYH